MAVFVVGLVGILFFYLIVLAVGIWAGIKYKGDSEVDTMNAGRRLGYIVGTLTLVGTWCGGGYINGSAEQFYSKGLIHVQVPLGYSIALVLGALVFMKKMRDANYITLLDPFQAKYGMKYGASLILPAIASEFFWCAAVLNSLGNALEVVLGIGSTWAIVISAIFAGLYTLVGGLYSVTYTDVLQLVFIVFGLVLCIPFTLTNSAADWTKVEKTESWFGTLPPEEIAMWIDDMILLICGGIPWQGYFQRVFSIKSTPLAIKMSWFSMVGTLLMAIPALLIGVAAKITDWSKIPYEAKISDNESMVLPLVLRYLCPPAVTFFALGAVAGAVMSSADSAILASSAMFSRNIYKQLFKPKVSDKELHWILRITIVIVTILAATIALFLKSIYYLSFLCADLVYVILFPQLLLTLHAPKYTNAYGSLICYVIGFILRVLGGEPKLGIPAVIKYPGYNEKNKLQLFPFKTFTMILVCLIFLLSSYLADCVFLKGNLNQRYDFLKVYRDTEPEESIAVATSAADSPTKNPPSKNPPEK